MSKKKFKPTWSKTYPTVGHPPVKKFDECNVAFITSTKGTSLHGMDDKIMNTAGHKMRRDVLRKHGKKALQKTYR